MTALYAHQQAILDRFPKRHLIAWQVGTGKTYAALALAKKAAVFTLIICPKGVKEKWTAQATEWLGAQALVVTKEEFKKRFKTLPKAGAVIVDEAHKEFANINTQSHKALAMYVKVHAPEHVWLLTGTPYTSSPWSVYGLARLVGTKWDYFKFRQQFFDEQYLGKRVVFKPKVGIEDALADKVREIGSVVRLDECIDMPEQTHVEEFFDLTAPQRLAIKTLQVNESNPLTRFGKSHQIAQGILLGDGYSGNQFFESDKIKRFLEICEENEKVVAWSKYNLVLETLGQRLDDLGIPYVIINGNTPDRESLIEKADASSRIVILAQSACAEGWEIPSVPVTVFVTHSYSFVDYTQACGRVLRVDKPKPNLYITLTTRGSADIPVLESLKNKRSFSEAIFAREHPEGC